jgi:hypothetical protein
MHELGIATTQLDIRIMLQQHHKNDDPESYLFVDDQEKQ